MLLIHLATGFKIMQARFDPILHVANRFSVLATLGGNSGDIDKA